MAMPPAEIPKEKIFGFLRFRISPAASIIPPSANIIIPLKMSDNL